MAKLVKTYDENMHLNGVQKLEDGPKVKYYDWSELDTVEGFLTGADGLRIAQEIIDGTEVYIRNFFRGTKQYCCERVSMKYDYENPPLDSFLLFLFGIDIENGKLVPFVYSIFEL